MKPILIRNTSSPNLSFTIEERIKPHFSVPYHFHNEYELTAILKGRGSRFVGNHISSFDNSDMVLIGKNLPHHWHNDKTASHPNEEVKAIILKFDADFNGVRLFDLPENYQIQKVLEKASSGLRIVGETFNKLVSLMQSLLTAKGPDRISLLLKILHEIAISDNLEVLSNQNHIPANKSNDYDNDRMNRVYAYIMNNYLEEISLLKVAEIACMNEAAFCKYFKKRYNKTLMQVVNEIRINYACKELLKDNANITEVCYQSGFNTFSNFAKTFKKITGTGPREYKMKIRKLEK